MSGPHALTLPELIDKASQRRGTTSTHKLARIAREAGHGISHSTIASIRKGSYPSAPGIETLDALAFLAGVPERVAREAAGLPVSEVPFARQLPPDVDLLRGDQRDAVLKVIRLFVDAEKRVTADDSAGPVEDNHPPRRTVLRDENDPLLQDPGSDEQEERN